jgi:hypothetical protein
MELTVELSPLAYAELYRHLYAEPTLRASTAARIEQAGGDGETLRKLEVGYQALWRSQVDLADGDPAQLWGLDDRHAQLATWLLAGHRDRHVPSQELAAIVLRSVGEAYMATFGATSLPESFRPTVIAWTLGQIRGGHDTSLPAISAVTPPDPDVTLAYAGLVTHLLGLPIGDNPWPEVAGSAVLWRAAGVVNGLYPQPRGDLHKSIAEAMDLVGDVIPDYMLRQLSSHWNEFRLVRNGLTHVAKARNGYSFCEVADRACTWEQVRLAITGITHFVFNRVALHLLESPDAVPAERLLVEISTDLASWADAALEAKT